MDAPFSVDDARVDVGASAATGARALGVSVLTPVTLSKKPLRYGSDLLAAPMAGRRAACAALVLSAREAKPATGTVVVAFVTEQNLSERGLRTVRRTQGPFVEERLVDGGAGVPGVPTETAEGWLLPAAYTTTAVETVSLPGADSLRARIGRWIAGPHEATRAARDIGNPAVPIVAQQQPSLDDVRSVLAPLIESYGVSGMEGPVRDAVSRMLPSWARATTDTAGNLIVSVGEASRSWSSWPPRRDRLRDQRDR